MQIELYLVLSAVLVGIGIASALSRGSILAVIMGLTTAGMGALVAMAAFHQNEPNSSDGMFFALCVATMILNTIILGCTLTYRRFMASGTTNIGEKNELRH
ncbi:MAG: NADH-quinone oxidoreductase subunit K [Bdellovibrionota bacterium]